MTYPAESCGCSPKDWSPVCGDDGFTYTNECKARCDQTTVLCKGACPCSKTNAKRIKDEDNKDEFDGKKHSKGYCGGWYFRLYNFSRIGCNCEKVFDPVCGLDGNAYPNPCTAECHGASIECEGKCPCEFDDEDNKGKSGSWYIRLYTFSA